MLPLDPDDFIADLCQRHGVSRGFGRRLRPLLERAAESAPKARQRILELVELSFLQEAERLRLEARQESHQIEFKMLETVATILHGWEPPGWLRKWGEALENDDRGDS